MESKQGYFLWLLLHLSFSSKAMQRLEASFPWKALVIMLNPLLRFYKNYPGIEGDLLPVPEKNDCRPTPEEFALRGLFWTVRYFIPGWFRNKNIEDENQYKEDASMDTEYRRSVLNRPANGWMGLGCLTQSAARGPVLIRDKMLVAYQGMLPIGQDIAQGPELSTEKRA
jgi:hypothetical protein